MFVIENDQPPRHLRQLCGDFNCINSTRAGLEELKRIHRVLIVIAGSFCHFRGDRRLHSDHVFLGLKFEI